MPNGYDGHIADIHNLDDFSDYCKSLLEPQRKMLDSVHDLRSINSALRPRMINLLNETEAIATYVKQVYHQVVKPGIIEHNESKGEMGKSLTAA